MDPDPLPPEIVRRIGGLLGVDLPESRAAAIARDLDALAARLRAAPVKPGFEDEPASFQRVQQPGERE